MEVIKETAYPFIYLKLNGDNEEKNLLTITMMDALIHEIESSMVDEKCRYIVILGGKRYFCFGGSLGDYKEMEYNQVELFADTLIKLHIVLANCEKITIAGIEGLVGGAGFSLVEVCDFAIAIDVAEFCLPEIENGRVPMISLNSIRKHFTRKQCMEMSLLGDRLSSRQAKEYGLINVVTSDNIRNTVEEFAHTLDKISMTDFRLFKRYYNILEGKSINEQFFCGKELLISLLTT